MALTTRAIVLERLGIIDDSIDRAAMTIMMDATAHTSAIITKAGSTSVTVRVDGGSVNTFLLATYTTIGTLAAAINTAALGVTATSADDEVATIPSTLLNDINVTLIDDDPATLMTYDGAYATGNATLIDRLITEVDYAIGRACNRLDATTGAQTFESASRDEKYDGCGEPILSLRNFPVSSITSVALVDTAGTNTTLASTDYTADLRTGRLQWNGTTAYWPGWTDYTGAPAYGYEPPGWPRGFQNVRVQYTAGYSTVPKDLQSVATQMVVDMYLNRKTNERLSAYGIGDKSASYRSAEDLAALHSATLAQYRRPVF